MVPSTWLSGSSKLPPIWILPSATKIVVGLNPTSSLLRRASQLSDLSCSTSAKLSRANPIDPYWVARSSARSGQPTAVVIRSRPISAYGEREARVVPNHWTVGLRECRSLLTRLIRQRTFRLNGRLCDRWAEYDWGAGLVVRWGSNDDNWSKAR